VAPAPSPEGAPPASVSRCRSARIGRLVAPGRHQRAARRETRRWRAGPPSMRTARPTCPWLLRSQAVTDPQRQRPPPPATISPAADGRAPSRSAARRAVVQLGEPEPSFLHSSSSDPFRGRRARSASQPHSHTTIEWAVRARP
jgi:hypothetical protein